MSPDESCTMHSILVGVPREINPSSRQISLNLADYHYNVRTEVFISSSVFQASKSYCPERTIYLPKRRENCTLGNDSSSRKNPLDQILELRLECAYCIDLLPPFGSNKAGETNKSSHAFELGPHQPHLADSKTVRLYLVTTSSMYT